jgi:hypothetical protein
VAGSGDEKAQPEASSQQAKPEANNQGDQPAADNESAQPPADDNWMKTESIRGGSPERGEGFLRRILNHDDKDDRRR